MLSKSEVKAEYNRCIRHSQDPSGAPELYGVPKGQPTSEYYGFRAEALGWVLDRMAREESSDRRRIVDSFRNEVSYIQGTINSDTDECRSRRWKSLHTVVGLLSHYFGLEDLHDEIGFVSLQKKESGDAES